MSKVKLSALDRSMLPIMITWRNNPKIYKWCRQYEPINWESHETWYTRIQSDPKIKMYGIKMPTISTTEGLTPYEGEHFIGVCGLTDIDYINRRAEFSLYIDPDRHGEGYGEAALRELLSHAFQVLNLNCVWGETFDGNPALKMFNKIGFKLEGTRRQFYFRDGKYIDAHLVSITRDEYAHA